MNRRRQRLLIVVACVIAVGAVGIGIHAYRIAHPSPPRVRAEGIRVVAVGDSITHGYGIADRDKDSYPARLQGLLGPDYQVLDYGLIGRTLQDSGDLPYRKDDFYRMTLEVSPAIVLIMLGTNDTKPQNWDAGSYERQLADFVDSYKHLASHPRVYLMAPPAAFASAAIDGDIIANQVVPIVHRVGEQTDTPVIDIHAATRDHPEWFPDGVHPDEVGADVIAQTVYAALTR